MVWHWIVETERLLYTASPQARAGCGAVIAVFISSMVSAWLLVQENTHVLEVLGTLFIVALAASFVGMILGLLAPIVVPFFVAVVAGFVFGWIAVQISRVSKVRK